MEYGDFDLWVVTGSSGEYPVIAQAPFHLGEAQGRLCLDPASAPFPGMMQRLDVRDTDRDFIVTAGRALQERLFADEVGLLFEQALGTALARRGTGMRLRLHVHPPEIAALPWELLYHPKQGSFLSTLTRFPVVRYQDQRQPIPALHAELPLRLLVVMPDVPPPYPPLDTERERRKLAEALDALGERVETRFLDGQVPLQRLSDALLEENYHCCHFIGHGEWREDSGYLLMNDEAGGVDPVNQSRFAAPFRNHEPMKLVVLNACKGARLSASRSMSGMAPHLVRSGIPAVVAMQFAVYDQAAVLFAREFYRALFAGRNRGRVDYALCHARQRLDDRFGDERDLGAPVLYLRARDGLLFDLSRDSGLRAFDISEEEHHTRRTVQQAYETNLEMDREQGRESAQDRQGLTAIKRRIRFRNGLFVTSTAAVLLLTLAAAVRLFDLLGLDTRLEGLTIALGGLFSEAPLHPRIRFLPITGETERRLGKAFDRSWREQHARVLDALSQAGAGVVAFDLYFPEPSAHDEGFAAAIERARTRGTRVILGYRELAQGEPRMTPMLAEAADGAALLCVGRRLAAAFSMPVAVARAGSGGMAPSLAAAVFMGDQGFTVFVDDRVDWDAGGLRLFDPVGSKSGILPFSEVRVTRWAQPDCPAIGPGDRVAELILEPPPAGVLNDPRHRLDYAQLSRGEAARESVRDALVLVGLVKADDAHLTNPGWSEERFGLELHAVALSALLDGRVIRSLGFGGQMGLMVLLAAVGGFIRFWVPREHRGRRSLLLGAVVLLYLAGALGGFVQFRLLFNLVYHLAALLLAYWLAGKVERKWAA